MDGEKIEDGLQEIELVRYADSRGEFQNIHIKNNDEGLLGEAVNFVMDNVSKSKKGVLRGLHYQKHKPQGKLVTVLQGAIYDVAVDIREGSSTYGKWSGVEITDRGSNQVWVPPGFAHGFLALEEDTIVHYKVTEYYEPSDQYVIAWNDPELAIEWPKLSEDFILSERDQQGLSFSAI